MQFSILIKTLDAKKSGLHELTDEELLKIQKILVEMLQDIADTCERNDISWSLVGGSALGAVRHKGFIPWDDDIDIYMMREDYCKFRECFSDELSSKYELCEPGQKNYLLHYPTIYKKGTIAKSIQSDNLSPEGVYIEIFPIENVYQNKLLRYLHGLECTAYLFVDSVLRVERCKDNILKYGGESDQIKKEVKKRIFFAKFFHFSSLEKWLQRSDRCFSKVRDKSSDLVVAPSGALHYFGELYDREKMSTLIKIPFEGRNFNIMKDYDYYLKKRYGENYMEIPDEGSRERHSYIELNLDG